MDCPVVKYNNSGSVYISQYNIEHNDSFKSGCFHKWVEKSKMSNDDDMRGENNIYALVETPDGLLELAHYTCVKFIDSKWKELCGQAKT